MWKEMHPNRLRRAIAMGLCQVCGKRIKGPMISLSVMEDGRVIEPFLDKECASISIALCPSLKEQIEDGAIRVREVTEYRFHPAYADEQQEIIDGLDIELVTYRERGLEWISTAASS